MSTKFNDVTVNSNVKGEKLFSDQQPMRAATLRVVVNYEETAMFDRLAEELLYEMNRVATQPVPELVSENLRNYLTTLTWLRISRVNKDFRATQEYSNCYRKLRVPTVQTVLLAQLGIAMDNDFGLEFVPHFTPQCETILAVEDMQMISDWFVRIEQLGISSQIGIPEKEEGDLHFMAMCHVNEEVVSYKKSHPVFAFYASFFAQQELNAITGAMCRVQYGTMSDYSANLASWFQAMKG